VIDLRGRNCVCAGGVLHLTSFYDWRALEWLGVQLPNLPEKHYSNTPLALSLRALFDHVTGVAPAPETVRDACQRVCEALFVAARVAGREYTIPAEFWETLTGQAIRAAFGGSPEIGDNPPLARSWQADRCTRRR
jgi:hypothetical protein